MLKTVEHSGAKKTRGIAVTYRAGSGEKYATCPKTCELNCSGKGSEKIDSDYLKALLRAVPKKGVAFTYSHFHWSNWHMRTAGQTVINYSAQDLALAAVASLSGPTVVIMSESDWHNGKLASAPLPTVAPLSRAVPVVRCPAEYREGFSCSDCGNGLPLCARQYRNYIIGFTAHGSGKKKAASPDVKGGCYADGGHVRLHWDITSNAYQPNETDGQKLRRFARSLAPRSILRHHVAGDIGQE